MNLPSNALGARDGLGAPSDVLGARGGFGALGAEELDIFALSETLECTHAIREDFKYYFADFVRKGGTPPPLLRIFFPAKKGLQIWGVPPPPFTDIFLLKNA